MTINQITIIGTGLIGGSLGLALKSRGLVQRVIGFDREDVLSRAIAMGAVDAGQADPLRACVGSQVVVLATPVGGIIDLLEKLGPLLQQDVLLTDVGSTKEEVSLRARQIFGANAESRYLPGHPMAGKEESGIEHASADLFSGAVWLFTPFGPLTEAQAGYQRMLEQIGARILTMTADRHDRLCAWISHLQQFTSTAIASTLVDFAEDFHTEFGDAPEIHAIGGRALREMTRIASSPYSMWRDIAFTNTANIEDALLKLEQKLAHLRENLKSPELREQFTKANSFSPQRHGDTEKS